MKTVLTAVQRFFFRDTTAVFLVAALFSSYATVIALVYHNSSGFTPSTIPAVRISQSPVDLSRQFRSQVSFVSNIIKSHAPALSSHEQLAKLIVEESARAAVDPLFVAAVIRSESRFRAGAMSHRGARGLMQLMPDTAHYVSKRENIRVSSLNDPSTNIRLGIAYLKYLEKMFNGDRERMFIAYNWGPANMSQSLRGKRTPPRQSVNYAREIMKQHRQWKSSLQEVAFNEAPLATVRAMLG